MKKKVIIIGAGISGLATAALLGKDGFDVTVFEKNSEIGGRARIWKSRGFTFDMGPSWYMMPEVFDGFFKIFNKSVSDFYSLKKLQLRYGVYFTGGRKYLIGTDISQNIDLFEKTEKGAGKKLINFLEMSRNLYTQAMKELVFLDYKSLRPLLNPNLIYKLLNLNLNLSFHSLVKKYFKNPDLQKIIEFTTVFLGGSPYNTPAFYTLIAHTDFNEGIWYPVGGMGEIVKALYKLNCEYNADIKLNSPVSEIISKSNRASSVIVNGKEISADLIINSVDYHHAETDLIKINDQTYKESYWQKKILAPSAFVIYLGIKGKISNLNHHTLYFDNSWEKHFRNVYNDPKWPDDPSYYIHCPSKTDPDLAPPDCDSIMILVPVSPGLPDSLKIRNEFSDKIIKHFESIIGESLSGRIVTKRIFAHNDFISDYNAYKGTAFGLSHTLFQTAIFRPKNFSRKVKNLFYTGQYTNPGVGVPISLISAQIVRNLINSYV